MISARAAVEAGLRLLIQTRAQASIRKLRGKVKWGAICRLQGLGEPRASKLWSSSIRQSDYQTYWMTREETSTVAPVRQDIIWVWFVVSSSNAL